VCAKAIATPTVKYCLLAYTFTHVGEASLHRCAVACGAWGTSHKVTGRSDTKSKHHINFYLGLNALLGVLWASFTMEDMGGGAAAPGAVPGGSRGVCGERRLQVCI
jgi:hypothetical protein